MSDLAAQLAELITQRDILAEALATFANRDNWQWQQIDATSIEAAWIGPARLDPHLIAREALEKATEPVDTGFDLQ